ncbi:MAG: M28 family peptidase [Flavobacteriales bacterium]|nr:M28 family peptidase [Flavobacteriales bacterium]
MRNVLLICMVSVGFSAYGQKDSLQLKYAETITAKDLRKRLEIIASDEFEGRETGQEGQKKAANYIKEQFQEFGYQPIKQLGGYFQPYKLQLTYPDTVKLMVGSDTLQFLKDMYYFPGFGDMLIQTENLLYLGYGIASENYSDYAGVEVKDRVLMISGGEPKDKKGKSLVTGTEELSDWTTDWTKKIELAQVSGAKALLIIDNNFTSSVTQFGRYIKRPDLQIGDEPVEPEGIPLIYISNRMANRTLKGAGEKGNLQKLETTISKKGKPLHRELNVPVTIDVKKNREELTAENVLAYLPGNEKPDELVVVTAHYDHLGKKGEDIYNGADDDGSGTTTLLEIAQAFAQAKKEGNGPKRSMLFMTVSGEEKGLLGSEFYTDNPVFPLENTVTDLNIDMIGRIDEKHAPDSNYVYIIGSDKLSTELHALSEKVNETYSGLEFDYTYNDEKDPNRFYYRSDHYNFAKNQIPVIFYFTGVHEDYHQPTDTVDKIMFQKMEKIARLIFHTAWQVANRDKRLEVETLQPVKGE